MIADRIRRMLPSEWPVVTGDLPSTRDVVVGVIEYDGDMSTEYFGARDTSSIHSPLVKVVIRHTSYQTGNAWVEETKKILHRYHDDILLSVLMVGSPMYLGRSPEKLHEFQVTFRIQVKE